MWWCWAPIWWLPVWKGSGQSWGFSCSLLGAVEIEIGRKEKWREQFKFWVHEDFHWGPEDDEKRVFRKLSFVKVVVGSNWGTPGDSFSLISAQGVHFNWANLWWARRVCGVVCRMWGQCLVLSSTQRFILNDAALFPNPSAAWMVHGTLFFPSPGEIVIALCSSISVSERLPFTHPVSMNIFPLYLTYLVHTSPLHQDWDIIWLCI